MQEITKIKLDVSEYALKDTVAREQTAELTTRLGTVEENLNEFIPISEEEIIALLILN
jgi:hypothetical protein